MQNHLVITIARQYGSGGRSIGKMVADALQIPCLDKEIIAAAVAESGIHADLVRNNDEKAGSHLGQAIAFGGLQSYFGGAQNLNDKIFIAESEVIQKYASAGPCVIIGRCGNYILRENNIPHLSVFINADLEDRIQRAVKVYGEPERRIKERLAKMDKQRSHYHHYYTDERWMDLENYDITVNSSVLGMENTVKLILDAAKYRCK